MLWIKNKQPHPPFFGSCVMTYVKDIIGKKHREMMMMVMMIVIKLRLLYSENGTVVYALTTSVKI